MRAKGDGDDWVDELPFADPACPSCYRPMEPVETGWECALCGIAGLPTLVFGS